MEILQQFYENEVMREAVRELIVESLKEVAVEKAFNGESTTGIVDAKASIDKAFETMREVYGIIKEPNIQSSR